MKIITAKILDPRHLELNQPIPAKEGGFIQISVLDEGDEDRLWREAATKNFLMSYADEDGIYDKL